MVARVLLAASSLSGDHATVAHRPGYTATTSYFLAISRPGSGNRAPVMSEAPRTIPRPRARFAKGRPTHPKAGTKLPLAKAAPRRQLTTGDGRTRCVFYLLPYGRRPTPDQGRCFKPLF